MDSHGIARRCWRLSDSAKSVDIAAILSRKRVNIVQKDELGWVPWRAVRWIVSLLTDCRRWYCRFFARSARDLGFGYKASDLAQGRCQKGSTTTPQILCDFSVAITWLDQRCSQAARHLTHHRSAVRQ